MNQDFEGMFGEEPSLGCGKFFKTSGNVCVCVCMCLGEFPSATVHFLQLMGWEDISCRATHPGEMQEDCEDTSHTEEDTQGCSLRGQSGPGGTPESRIHSGHLVTERGDSVSRGWWGREGFYKRGSWGLSKFHCCRGLGAQLLPRPSDPGTPCSQPRPPRRSRGFYSSLPRPQTHPKTL